MAQNNYDTSQHLLPSAEYNDQAPMPQQFVPLPETPYSDNVDSEVLLQLKILVNLQQQALRRKPIGAETIYNGVLQLLAFCLAVAFGVFTIISWQVAREANGFATTANGLASTANTLARDAALQGDRADGVAEQANCMAAGALVLSLLDFCDSQAVSRSTSQNYEPNLEMLRPDFKRLAKPVEPSNALRKGMSVARQIRRRCKGRFLS